MSFQMENTAEILDRFAEGLRIYRLQDRSILIYVNRFFCEMTGYSKDELTSGENDSYVSLVYPSDRKRYADLIKKAEDGERTLSAEYRIVRKDGTVLYVSDKMTFHEEANGDLVGYSVLTDITSFKSENENLRMLGDTMPCGMVRYTCEKYPKITYINDRMKNILRISDEADGESDYLELCRDNIYLLIPMEERRRFSQALDRVCVDGSPTSGDLSVLCMDGSKARLYGWITKVAAEDGTEEFQSVCMDVTEQYNTGKQSGTERYLKALTDVYDRIFEYDFSAKTVKFIYGNGSRTFGRLHNIPMHMEEATAQWIENSVYEDDLPAVKKFFGEVFQNRNQREDRRPPMIRYRAVAGNGSMLHYTGTFLKLDRNVSLYCCRCVQDQADVDSLRSENRSLKCMNENMQEMVMRFTDGIAAFEVTENLVTPLYASDNICEFFGFTKDEWLPMMRKSNSIKDFVSRSGVDYDKFSQLLQNGEAEFTYTDINTDTVRRIKAICSQKHADGSSPRYVMLYKVDEAEKLSAGAHIYVRTFGYFDVFVDDKPIAFRNKKAKELLALLVDRRGGFVSSEEAISFLWEDEPVNAVTLARYRKEALRLKNTLEEYGIADILESVDGKRRIVTEKVRCDLYDYLSDNEKYAQLFKGNYLTNYSWGETTLGELSNDIYMGQEL